MNTLFHKAVVLACALLCAGPAVFAEQEAEYKVKIRGAKDGAVKKAIKLSSMTCKLQKRPPATLGQLRRRVEKDLPTIEAILESRSYYDGTVTYRIDAEREPMRVELVVEQGKAYRYRSIKLQFSGEPDRALKKIKPLLRRKRKVVAASVFAEQQRILGLMQRKGYPFPRLGKRTVVVDRETRRVDLVLEFDPGIQAVFGAELVEGLHDLEPKYILRQVPWKQGERYDAKAVSDFEKKLLSTGVFGTARVEPREPAGSTNAIPMRIMVSERKKRTIRLGASYSDIGPGGKINWVHRNFLGGGERFELAVSTSPIETIGEATMTRTGFLDANQSLVLDLEASRETPEAYDVDKVRGAAMVLRDFNPEIQGGLGLGYQYSKVEQFAAPERFEHVLFPMQLIFDYRDDVLNPVRGGQLYGRATYYEDNLDSESFLKSGVEGRFYQMLWEKYRLSSAFRLTLGSIDGADSARVPADERYYAGGGGSVRGYEYQAIGPKLGDTPTGGDKLVEFSAELRLQPGRKLGYALFLDGGAINRQNLRYGAGFGLRWFTSIGPLRVDVAYPLNPDSTQVERFQFYISLGQAF